MNIDDLTIGEAKKIAKMFSYNSGNPGVNLIDNGMLGKYVIVRCRDAGVHSGILESYAGRECVLTESRRLWYHKPADKSLSWYEGVAVSGLSEDSKCSGEVPRRHLTETCDIVLCAIDAELSIRGAKTNEQS